MADSNHKVASRCSWCGESFHQVEDRYSMHPCAIYTDYQERQFDSWYCLKMLNDNEKEDENGRRNNNKTTIYTSAARK